jgi:hypothetical protein
MVTATGADIPRSAGYAIGYDAQGRISQKKKELTMTKGLLVSLAILTLSTSAALAAHRTHHHHLMMHAAVAEPAPPVGWMGPINSDDHAMHLRNLHDSGYNPKNDFNAAGTIANQ